MRKCLLSAVTILLLISQSVLHAQNLKAVKEEDLDKAVKEMLNSYDQKIYFSENQGQWPANVKFKADFKYGQALATPKGMLIGTYDPESVNEAYERAERLEKAQHDGLEFNEPVKGYKGHGWLMEFVDASANMKIEAKDKHPDYFNYFMGDNQKEHGTNIYNYQEVWYKNVYDNVDVRYYPSEQGTLEYDIICKPGFDKNKIAIKFDGIDNISINEEGVLSLKTSVGDVNLPKPVVYQVVRGRRVSVDAKYVLTGNNSIRFELGNYDATLPLIIDPIALRWATWITNNSAGDNHAHGVWVDQVDGSIYTLARIIGSGLITQNAFQNASAGNLDVVIGRYTEPTTVGGAGVRVWQTYLGGSSDDNPYVIEQGADRNIYFTGPTSSTNYPLLGGSAYSGTSIDNRSQTTQNIFITKINTAGNSIKSAVIGGNNTDQTYDLRTTASGSVLVCGLTRSTNLATLYSGIGASNTNNGNNDVLVFKINSDLNTIAWMRNYGGSGSDIAYIMLNNLNDVYIGGATASSNFPLSNSRTGQNTLGGTQSGFLQKLDTTGNTRWSSYFKSASGASSSILCMEFNTAKNKIYFGGITTGLDASNISASGVLDNSIAGQDFFVARMDTSQLFNFSTYLGGVGNEVNMMGLNTDANDDVYIFGYTPSTDFPVTSDALQSTNLGSNDKTFTKLKSTLNTVLYSTYYGGTSDDYDPIGERGIKFSNCRIYTVVTAQSNNIPLTQGAVTTNKTSSTSIYEPSLVVWANPPDFINNAITPNQTICPGNTPGDVTGSLPSYLLPTISRNGSTSSYPALGGSNTYQWQQSTDSLTWTDIAGATSQNLLGSLLGPITQKIFLRRVIGGDACVIEQGLILYINTLSAKSAQFNATCPGTNDGRIEIYPQDGSPSYTYLWNDGATTKDRTGLAVGNYSVTITDAAGCKVVKSFTITYLYTKPDIVASATPSAICQGNSTKLRYSPINSVETVVGWFGNCAATGPNLGTDSTLTVSPLSTTTYSVVVVNGNGCRDTACVTVTVNTKPDVTATATQPSVCRTQSSNLSFTPNTGITTVNWYLDDAAAGCNPTGASLSTNSTYTVAPAATTAYSVIVQTAQGCRDTACVTLTILDCFPEAVRDFATTNEDIQVTIPVLANDTFGGNGPGTGSITITDNANHGTATVDNGGTPNDPTDDRIVYTPNANYNGNDTLIYQICDSDGDCDTAIVYITINPVNDLPTAVRDLAQGAEDSTITIAVLTNDTFGGDGPGTGSITITDNANHGTATVDNGGTPNDPTDDRIVYTPNANYNGNDTLIYQICDGYPTPGDCDTAIVYINVSPRNDLPTAVRDLAQGAEDSTITIAVLTNDTFGGDGPGTGSITITDNANHGTATVDNGGTPNDPTDDRIVYTPNANYNGNDTLIYQICDGYPTPGDCDTAIVYINVSPRNDLPTAVRDLAQGAEDSTITIAVLTNDTFGGDGPGTGSITITDNANHGTATVDNGGTPNDPTDDRIVYTPNSNYNGNDTLIYQICDGYPTPGDCDTAIVYITINPMNDLPTAVRDLAQGAEDSTITIAVLTNDTFGGDGPGTGSITITDNANHGTATVDNGGTPNDPTDDRIVYTPNSNYNGNDTLIYQICDGYPTPGDCDTAIVYINVSPRNDLPTAVRDLAQGAEDSTITIAVLTNDTFGGDGPGTGSITITDNANHGTATVDNGGTPNDPTDDRIVYTPNANYNGNDTLIYQICDGYPTPGDCDTAIVYITINPMNDLPTAVRDLAQGAEDSTITIAVLTNDMFGGDGPGTGSITITDNANHGTATVDNGGTPNDPTDDRIVYTPNANYNGNDTLIYQICDGYPTPGDCDTAIVYINVSPRNDLPTAVRDLAQGAEDSTITIAVLTNDTFGGDGPGTGSITITDNANHGTATVDNGGTPNDPTDDRIVYTPNSNYNGNDTLIYQICDGYPTTAE
ncbi:MAG: Ig-like domain-containing protein [Chitinophagales bacterium]